MQDPFMYGYEAVRVLAAVARGDKGAAETFKSIPYRVITKDGGDKSTVNGVEVLNLKATDFAAQLKERLASVKK
ncbi:MAG TPA: hypothetical protein VMZ71_04480 [Gemmataceae bacterium]|nr:hypothetical protein [Gemmataceae bacterium]